VVWDCGATHIDNEEDGRNNNRWVKNVLSSGKEEPPEAKALRERIEARRKKGYAAPDVGPWPRVRPQILASFRVVLETDARSFLGPQGEDIHANSNGLYRRPYYLGKLDSHSEPGESSPLPAVQGGCHGSECRTYLPR